MLNPLTLLYSKLGQREWGTGRNEFATAEDKPLKAKMTDNLKPDKGQIDKTSLNRSEYGKDGLVERPEKLRPLSNLKNEGSRAWDTGRNEFVQAEKRPLKAKKIDDNLSTYKGQIDKTSLNRSEYGKDGVFGKPEKAGKPNSQLKNEGNFNWETGRFEYNPAEQKPERAKKSEDNLQPLDGEMDKTTQNRSEYGKHGLVPRAELARPSTTNKPQGRFLISILSNIIH